MKSAAYQLTFQDEDNLEQIHDIEITFDYEASERNQYEHLADQITILSFCIDGEFMELKIANTQWIEAQVWQRSDEWLEMEMCEF